MPAFDLKLATGKVVTWDGTDELDAARRYVDTFRDATVVATRQHKEVNVVAVLARGYRIIEPDQEG
jgi:hypothetical protein